jgi:DNA-binding MarR family transcriptional regulator
MSERWSLFSNHAVVMVYVLQHPDSTVREIARGVGITERATLAILALLDEDRVILRTREGRRTTYAVNFERLSTFRRASVAPLTPAAFIDGLIETLLHLRGEGAARRAAPRRPETGELSAPAGSWGFFTNHLRVLIALAIDRGRTVHDIAGVVGITERAAASILKQVEDEGLISRERDGRRNVYSLDASGLRSFERWGGSAEWRMPGEIVEYCVRTFAKMAGD